MQSDSVQFSASGHMNETDPQESLAKSFHCTKCTLIFKSKVFLFEHLNKVHCLDINASLRDAGLKFAESKRANTENSRGLGKSFSCRSCDFKTCSQDILTEHEAQCRKTESPNLPETIIISDHPDTETPVTLANQTNEAIEAPSSKDLKTYKRPSQTITKYFTASSGSNGKLMLANDTNESLILLDTSPDPSLHWTVTSKATAKPGIDVYHRGTDCFLQSDHLYHAKVAGSDSQKEQTNIAINEIGRRPNHESLRGPKTKIAKLEKENKDQLTETEITKRKLSGSAEFSFEVSDDEEEKKVDFGNGDSAHPKVYFCKHCDFSDVSLRLVSSHYQRSHPYVRCTTGYIQQAADQSATFRCLECPSEFLSTVDLKWHYTEEHPDAPDMFKMKMNEFRLVFKCFTCTFTCNEVKALRHHYKENHPTCELDNYLLFCQYLVRKYQEDPSQQETCEKTSRPERSVELSPNRTSTSRKDVEVTPSRQPPTSTGPDVTLYKCSKCEFEHKSAVVMHVHYQKKHPEKTVTLDEIKRLARETSQMTPEKETAQKEKVEVPPQEKATASVVKLVPEASRSSSNVLRIETVRSLEDDTEKGKLPSKRLRKTTDRLEDLEMEEKVPSQAKQNPEQALQNDSILSLPEHASEANEKTSEPSTPKHVKSAKTEKRAKMSHSKPNRETSESKSDKFLCSSPLEMHYCQFCDYTSPQVRSVIGHHNAKHAANTLLSKEDIIQYSAEVIENKLKGQTISKTGDHSKSHKIEANFKKSDAKKVQVYLNAEKLFYCHLCNFGNPSAQGVITHQSRVHKYTQSSRESILEYTALILEKIKTSKSHGKNTTSPAHLPLPIINEGDKDMFFCHFCNYRNQEMSLVMHHYSRAHEKASNSAADIRWYTSKVLEQLQKSPDSSVNQKLMEKPEGKKEKANCSSKTFSSSAPLSVTRSETQRKLPCKYCTFTTQYVFLLMSHMRKIHFSKLSVTGILRLCFRKGALESGYHCEWCVFSHKKAEAVQKHYQEWHPGCKHMSLGTIKARLFVGSNNVHSKDKKTELKSIHQGLTYQSSGMNKNEDEIYSCTACSFKSNSKFALARHGNKFHPSPAKDLLDLPSDTGTREKSQLEDLSKMPGLFESFQVSLEDTDEETSSSTVFKCSLCPATFHSKHGLSVHSGIKHVNVKNVKEPKKQPEKNQGRMHVFKCPYCSYINTSYQGVLTHCQMRHPVSTSRADSLHVDPAHLQDLDDCIKRNNSGEILKFSGYICKTCKKICATLDKLNRHCEQDHNETAPSMAKPANKPFLGLKIKLAKPHRTLKAASMSSLLTKKVSVRLKCQQCSYVCSTNIALSKHMLKQHRNAALKDCVYKCMLCPQIYSYKKRLAKHYARKHGKSAYLKYYVSVYRPVHKNQEASFQRQEQQSSKDKRLIYRCPSCPYVNTTYHGTLTHSQMKHPSVIVRADALETGEILVSNIVRCSKGKGSYERGYLCKRCPQIHPSIKKLKSHYQHDHGDAAAFELFPKSEVDKEDDGNSLVTDEAATSLKTASQNSVHLQREHGKAAVSDNVVSRVAVSKSALIRNTLLRKDLFYKCQLCVYSTFSRKNLQAHYKGSHKLDALSTYKMLERYNKRKNNFLCRYADLKKRLHFKCKQCPESAFDSSQLLIDHYNTFHLLGSKSDFTVLSFGVKKESTGLYKCKSCKIHLHGIKKLCKHLDRHRDQMKASQKSNSLDSATTDPQSEVSQQDKLSTYESVEELSQWMGAPVEVSLPSSPTPPPSKLPDIEPEAEAQEDGHTCKRCQRTFMSLKGLRSHERSHAALGAIKKLDNLVNTEFKHNIRKYLLHKPETLKPFRCGCCAYRTNFMALWQTHFLKNHQDIIEMDIVETDNKDEEISQSADKEVPDSSEKITNLPELIGEPEDVEESTESYSEPPNVQRQLTHYSLMAQKVDKTSMNLHELSLSDSLLQCEMCNFNTEHLSSIRRHYANRHGKKMLKCKDCDFFTGLRKNMEMHIETGHSTCQSKPTHLKDLRCPFCLYQTKNKNNMIDHIVLHREERVVPIEVRRPKLSRYLQGIVFRCHKCTFTSGSAENLCLHVMRHDDVKPYKCRLCYFDCTRLTDLEAHLSDKHQVLRNHELVGQVSLNQLEAWTGTRPEKNNDHKSDNEKMEAEEFNADCDDVPQTDKVSEYHSTENMMLPIKEEQGTHEQEEHETIPANSSVADFTQDRTQQNTTVLKRHQQGSQTQEQNVALHHSSKKLLEMNTEPNADECNNADIKNDDCSFAEKEGQTSKNQTTLTDGQKEVTERSSTSFKMADVTDRLHYKEGHHKAQSIEAMVDDDIVRHVQLLDEDGSMSKSRGRPDPERNVKIGQNTEAIGEDKEKSDKSLSNDVCGTFFAQNLKFQDDVIANPATAKMNSAQGNNSTFREGFRFEPHMLTLLPNCTRLKLGHRESLGRFLANCKREQKQNAKIPKDESEPNREKGVLECVEEQRPHLEPCEGKEEADLLELKLDGEVDINMKDEDECKVQDTPHAPDDALTTMDGADELQREKLFTCELCGRNLMNISELNRHIMRHGI